MDFERNPLFAAELIRLKTPAGPEKYSDLS
jgi:hypothetical protein